MRRITLLLIAFGWLTGCPANEVRHNEGEIRHDAGEVVTGARHAGDYFLDFLSGAMSTPSTFPP